MQGFKAVCENMASMYGSMRFKQDKWYSISEEPELGSKGFHFCNNLRDTLLYYPLKGSRFFKVEADGKILKGDSKNVAEKIKLIEV